MSLPPQHLQGFHLVDMAVSVRSTNYAYFVQITTQELCSLHVTYTPLPSFVQPPSRIDNLANTFRLSVYRTRPRKIDFQARVALSHTLLIKPPKPAAKHG
ncbi:hypothetical protein CCM_05201 [Cordyceps militaris CM01]|uniref:Uncharacterized protein n=1 Tax=Cordyceps militaris (strain CM01) TaxID=983644 RepID=G3JIE3_CORMM|nr:uncharacterized protein CCM_05201 [Cordyceps militaris CM01]EGX91044.1 hypothetical protein CCM_05201 [Cordyceps militaris CM01]